MTETDVSDGERFSSETGSLLDGVWGQWGRVDPELCAERYHSRFIPEEIWRTMGVQEAEPPSVEYPSFRVVRRQYGAVVTSYGLSFPDQWSDEDLTNGVGVEVYAAGLGVPRDWRPNEMVTDTWLGQMVWSVAKNVSAGGAQFLGALEHYGTLSMSLPGLTFPDEARGSFVADNGDVAVLIGMRGDGFPDVVTGPLGPIRLVNIKLLSLAELDFCLSGTTGVATARDDLAQRFAARPEPLWSSLTRESVV
ncbi:hypothetical protein [Nocardia sp. NPDC050406]|uniref:hypothetical protein n=1 Tax=Nocardia sp. NPDC050406 TaxID=3364318 RepID=UPI00379BD32F